jgi:bud site selection protein 31
MPLPSKWNQKRKKPPPNGFDYVEPTLEALENELRDKVKESNMKQRKIESLWPIHQINWQKSRYIYDLYYTYHRISKEVYQYCIDQKLVDAALIAKWKKPGYERLCSTYVINPSNYKFGTTSICRVPFHDRNEDQKYAKDPTTGCMGCASTSVGSNSNTKSGNNNNKNDDMKSQNIFGTKYGQNLAAIQIAREKRMALKQQKEQEALLLLQQQQQQEEATTRTRTNVNDDDDETDDDDDDYGPTVPSAKEWVTTSSTTENNDEQQLDQKEQHLQQNEKEPTATKQNHDDDNVDDDDDDKTTDDEAIGNNNDEDEDEDEDDNNDSTTNDTRPNKKLRM